MKRTDVKDLFDRACESRITPDEIAEVMERLEKYYADETAEPGFELWSLLQALRFVGIRKGVQPENKKIVAKFLYYPKSPNISAIALSILCIDWHLAKEFRDHIILFLSLLEWDYGIVWIVAIKAAGELLREGLDKECLKHLVSAFDNPPLFKWANNFSSEDVYRSLLKAFHIEFKEVPRLEPDQNYWNQPYALQIVERARNLIVEMSK